MSTQFYFLHFACISSPDSGDLSWEQSLHRKCSACLIAVGENSSPHEQESSYCQPPSHWPLWLNIQHWKSFSVSMALFFFPFQKPVKQPFHWHWPWCYTLIHIYWCLIGSVWLWKFKFLLFPQSRLVRFFSTILYRSHTSTERREKAANTFIHQLSTNLSHPFLPFVPLQ